MLKSGVVLFLYHYERLYLSFCPSVTCPSFPLCHLTAAPTAKKGNVKNGISQQKQVFKNGISQ